MIVHGNRDWPTVRYLNSELKEVPGPPIAYGFGMEGVFGGSPRKFGQNQLRVLSEAGVPVPYFTDDWQEAIQWLKEENTIFGRNNQHTQGKDIALASWNKEDALPTVHSRFFQRAYWTLKVPGIIDEWRVHVFHTANGYRSIATGKKVADTPTSPLIKSRRNGWKIAYNHTPPKGLRPIARQAVEALGYDFGAVDVVQTQDNATQDWREFVVLEVNSAPGLTCNHTQNVYKQAFTARR